jgi:hypothetical protein
VHFSEWLHANASPIIAFVLHRERRPHIAGASHAKAGKRNVLPLARNREHGRADDAERQGVR